MTQVSRLCAQVLAPYRPVHLYTRAHIDLQRFMRRALLFLIGFFAVAPSA